MIIYTKTQATCIDLLFIAIYPTRKKKSFSTQLTKGPSKTSF